MNVSLYSSEINADWKSLSSPYDWHYNQRR